MTSILEIFRADHRICDAYFTAAEAAVARGDWKTGEAAFLAFAKVIDNHFREEEDRLFPAFERATGSTQGPTQVMRREHAQMRQVLQELQLSCQDHDREGFLGLTETLLLLTQQHNIKEEQILYPAADRFLGPLATDLLAGLPEGFGRTG